MKNLFSKLLTLWFFILSGCDYGSNINQDMDLIIDYSIQLSNLSLNFEEQEFDFGDVFPSKLKSFKITNDTEFPENISLVVGGDSFFIQRSSCPQILIPNQSCTVQILAQTRIQYKGAILSGALEISSSNILNLSLKARSINERLSPNDPEALPKMSLSGNFPSLEKRISNVYIKNTGKGLANISDLSLNLEKYVVRLNHCSGSQVQPNNYCRIQLALKREEAILHNPKFEIKYTDVSGEDKFLIRKVEIVSGTLSGENNHDGIIYTNSDSSQISSELNVVSDFEYEELYSIDNCQTESSIANLILSENTKNDIFSRIKVKNNFSDCVKIGEIIHDNIPPKISHVLSTSEKTDINRIPYFSLKMTGNSQAEIDVNLLKFQYAAGSVSQGTDIQDFTDFTPIISGDLIHNNSITSLISQRGHYEDFYTSIKIIDKAGNSKIIDLNKTTALSGGEFSPSCKEIKNNPTFIGSDGMYLLDKDGSGPSVPYYAYCEMTSSDGGGWTWITGTHYQNNIISSIANLSLSGVDPSYSSIDGSIEIKQGNNYSGPCSGPEASISILISGIPHSEISYNARTVFYNATARFFFIDFGDNDSHEYYWDHSFSNLFAKDFIGNISSTPTNTSRIVVNATSCQYNSNVSAKINGIKVR